EDRGRRAGSRGEAQRVRPAIRTRVRFGPRPPTVRRLRGLRHHFRPNTFPGWQGRDVARVGAVLGPRRLQLRLRTPGETPRRGPRSDLRTERRAAGVPPRLKRPQRALGRRALRESFETHSRLSNVRGTVRSNVRGNYPLEPCTIGGMSRLLG